MLGIVLSHAIFAGRKKAVKTFYILIAILPVKCRFEAIGTKKLLFFIKKEHRLRGIDLNNVFLHVGLYVFQCYLRHIQRPVICHHFNYICPITI